MTAIKVELKNNWRWKERNTAINDVWSETYHWDRWHFVRKAVPSEIHIELVEAGAIPLPYAGFNEHKIQCKSKWFDLCYRNRSIYGRGRRARMVVRTDISTRHRRDKYSTLRVGLRRSGYVLLDLYGDYHWYSRFLLLIFCNDLEQ